MAETRIVSFVVRFVQQENDQNQPAWRGLIRHVQSREEHHFQLLPDALRFMGRYVDLADVGYTPVEGETDARAEMNE